MPSEPNILDNVATAAIKAGSAAGLFLGLAGALAGCCLFLAAAAIPEDFLQLYRYGCGVVVFSGMAKIIYSTWVGSK